MGMNRVLAEAVLVLLLSLPQMITIHPQDYPSTMHSRSVQPEHWKDCAAHVSVTNRLQNISLSRISQAGTLLAVEAYPKQTLPHCNRRPSEGNELALWL